MWSAVKRDPGENVEARGKPLVAQCELSKEINAIWVEGSPINSICSWDLEPDSVKEYF